ncbi:protein adenylyltransferase SelO-like isoform X2 [Elgaria multicarinata webbii]|uniref:protein adenylyltransferase SelO-like isoform X2 n=1 Tax=Elgaria multicarinata webbii TaxID=159646 RepID=UPI002FCCC1EB
MSRYCVAPWLFTWLMLICQSGCYLLDPIIATSCFSHVHNYINKSNLDQDYCERKRKLLSLCGWRLSTEKFTAKFAIDRIQDNYVREVRDVIFSVVYPTPFKSRVLLVAVSKDVLEDILDLDMSVSSSEDFLQLVSGAKVTLESLPLAHRYGGHQFGSWAGQLGDGRAHLIGIYTNRFGDRWELQLKGSGRTPYSRNGDGRAVLHSSVREFLGSEAMHYLGIPTSRAARGLLDFVIDEHFPFINMNDSNRYLVFFSRVVSETANLIALWMSVGFAHGVCNTDNFSLLSITIDYGPFGFMDSYDPDFVPNTSDDERRYKIGNQANVGMFNLNKLLQALNPLLDPRQKQLASQILEEYPEQYYKRFAEVFKAKLGLLGDGEDDNYLIAFLLKLIEDTKADFTMTFRQLSEISQDQLKDLRIPKEFWALKDVAKHKFFSSWVAMYLLRLKRNTDDSDAKRSRRMTSINPRYVLRNWMAESAVRKAARNDFSEVRFLQRVLQDPFQVQTVAERAGYAQRPPAWAKNIKVSCSS